MSCPPNPAQEALDLQRQLHQKGLDLLDKLRNQVVDEVIIDLFTEPNCWIYRFERIADDHTSYATQFRLYAQDLHPNDIHYLADLIQRRIEEKTNTRIFK